MDSTVRPSGTSPPIWEIEEVGSDLSFGQIVQTKDGFMVMSNKDSMLSRNNMSFGPYADLEAAMSAIAECLGGTCKRHEPAS